MNAKIGLNNAGEVRQMQALAADWQKEWQSLRVINRLLRNGHKTERR
jgi:hypothetical protein